MVRYEVGDRVEAKYRMGRKWYPAIVASVRGEDRYALDFDDGDKDILESRYIRFNDEIGASKTDKDLTVLEAGDVVEARYRGRDKWFPAVVAQAHIDGTVDLDYEDGDVETRVSSRLVRRRDSDSAQQRKKKNHSHFDEEDEDYSRKKETALISTSEREALSDWVLNERSTLLRALRKERKLLPLTDCRDIMRVPRKLFTAFDAVANCLALDTEACRGSRTKDNVAVLDWQQLLDALLYNTESKRIAVLRSRLSHQLVERGRKKGDTIDLGRELRRALNLDSNEEIDAEDFRQLLGENEGRPAIFCGPSRRRRGEEPLLSSRDIQTLIQHFEIDGTIDPSAFVRWIGPHDDEQFLERALAKLRRGIDLLDQQDHQPQKALHSKLGRGDCSYDEFREAILETLGLPLAPAEIDAIAAQFDSGDGVQYEQAISSRKTIRETARGKFYRNDSYGDLDDDNVSDASDSRRKRGSSIWNRAFKAATRVKRDESPADLDSDEDLQQVPAILSKRGARAVANAINQVHRDQASLTRIFERADKAGNGFLSKRDFLKCLSNESRGLGISLQSKDQANLLHVLFSADDDNGDVRYQGHDKTASNVLWGDFVDFLAELASLDSCGALRQNFSASSEKKIGLIYRRIVPQLKDNNLDREDLVRALERCDDKGNGLAKLDDFVLALKRSPLSLDLSSSERELVARRFVAMTSSKSTSRISLGFGNSQQSSYIDYAAFARWVTADGELAEAKFLRAVQVLYDRYGSARVRCALEKLTIDGKESIAIDDFVARFTRPARIPLSEGETRALCARLGSRGNVSIRKLLRASEETRHQEDRRVDSEDDDYQEKKSLALISATMKEKLWQWATRERKRGGLRRVFDVIDRDGSGSIELRELRKILEKADIDLTRSELDGFFELIDTDDDGSITYQEFAAFALTKVTDHDTSSIAAVHRRLLVAMVESFDTKEVNALKKDFIRKCRNRADDDTNAPASIVIKVLNSYLSSDKLLSKKEVRTIIEEFAVDPNDDDTLDFHDIAGWLYVDVKRALRKVRRGLNVYKRLHDGDVRSLFRSLDRKRRGSLTLSQFRHALIVRLGLPLSDAEICALFSVFDADNSDQLEYTEFVKLARSGTLPLQRRNQGRSSNKIKQSKSLDDDDQSDDDGESESIDGAQFNDATSNEIAIVSSEFRRALDKWAKREHSKEGGLRSVFKKYDKNKDGELDNDEFRDLIMKILDCTPSEDDVNALVGCLDVDGDGNIDYEEFVSFLRGSETKKISNIRRKIRQQLLKRRKIKHSWMRGSSNAVDIAAAIGALDSSSRGYVSAKDFCRALIKAPISLTLDVGEATAVGKYFALSGIESEQVDFIAFARWLGADAAGSTAWEYLRGKRLNSNVLRRRFHLRDSAKDRDIQEALIGRSLSRAEKKFYRAVKLIETIQNKHLGRKPSQKELRRCFFARMDRNDNGQVSRDEMRKAFFRMGIPFARDEANALLDRFDVDNSGTISYREFANIYLDTSSSKKDGMDNKKAQNVYFERTDASVDKIAKRVRRAIRGDGSENANWEQDVAHAFKDMDKDKSGQVDSEELTTWLCDRLRLKLSPAERKVLLDCFDTDASGTVSYDEFIDFVLEAPEGDEIGTIAIRIRETLDVKGCAILRSELLSADKNSTGAVRAPHLWAALSTAAVEVGAAPHRLDLSPKDQLELATRFALKREESVDVNRSRIRYDHLCSWLESGLGDNALDKLRRKIHSLERRRGGQHIDARMVFNNARSSAKGNALSREDLGMACEQCGIYLSDAALNALMTRFDSDGSGSISWGEFRRAVFPEKKSSSSVGPTGSGCDTLDENLANALESLFTAFDADGDGSLSKKELKALVPHVLSAFGLNPDTEEQRRFADVVRRGVSGKSISYKHFETVAIKSIRTALDAKNKHPVKKASVMIEFRSQLEAMDFSGTGRISRKEFEDICMSSAHGGLSQKDAAAIGAICAAYRPGSSGLSAVDSTSKVDMIETAEVMRLLRAAAEGGLDGVAAEAAAAPYRRRFDFSSQDRNESFEDVQKRAGLAVLKLLTGAQPDPSRYLLAFVHPSAFSDNPLLPKSFRESILAPLEHEPTHTLAATLAPSGVLAAAAAARTNKSAMKRREIFVSLSGAHDIPAPAIHAEELPRVQRFLRCCVVRRDWCKDEAPVSNIHCVRAETSENQPDSWYFPRCHRSILQQSMHAHVTSMGEAQTLVSEGLNAADLLLTAEEKASEDGSSKLALLFELTVLLPKFFFTEGNAIAAPQSQTTSWRGLTGNTTLKKESDDSDEFGSDDDSDYGLSSSSDEDWGGTKRGRSESFSSDEDDVPETPAPRRRRARDESPNSDRVYSDSGSEDETPTPKKNSKKKKRKPPRKSWYNRKLRKGPQKTGNKKKRGARQAVSLPEVVGDHDHIEFVEVSCGWTLVPIDSLEGRYGTMSLELKGGAPSAEDEISQKDVPWRYRNWLGRLKKIASGKYKSRLIIRLNSLSHRSWTSRSHSTSRYFTRIAIFPQNYAGLMSAYASYLEGFLSAQVRSATSAHVAEPVLAIFRKLVAVEPFRLALRALWKIRFDQVTKDSSLSANTGNHLIEAPIAALQKAVLELWPVVNCSENVDRRLSQSDTVQRALGYIRDVLKKDDDPKWNRVDAPQSPELYAPFHTREVVLKY